MKKLVLLLALMGIVAIGYSKDEGNNDNDNKTEYTITQNLGYCLYYTSSDGEIVKPTHSSPFDATILSNTYRDGVGVIEFDAPITTIGNSAFADCYRLTSVNIPNSVTTIGELAFYDCDCLTSVIIPNSVTTIGNYAFRTCCNLRSVMIPNSVTTIGESAFYGCSSLQEFNSKYASEDGRCLIIDGVLNSFAPAGLTEYNIPNSVTTIGDGAFRGCDRLTSIIIPNTVTAIGNYAFLHCGNLTSVMIPSGVTTIGNFVFAYCSDLTRVTIPNSVTTIGESAFQGCHSLQKFNGKYASGDCRCLIKDGVLNSFAPAGLIEYSIPDSVTTIGNYAFRTCSNLRSVTIPSSVTTIGICALQDCDFLISVTVPNSVTTIGNYAFADCDCLTSVTIPNSVITIGDAAFGGCRSLQKFNGKYASEDGRCLIIDGVLNSFASAGLTEYSIPSSVTTIGDGAFRGCDRLTSVTIPNSVDTIGVSVFRGCHSLQEFNGKYASEDGRCLIIDGVLNYFAPAGLTEYSIPNSVTTIGNYAFRFCCNLTSVTIPNSVTTIGERAFYDCDCLTSVTIPNSVTTIGERAFYDCDCLTSVTILNSVTTIGERAFARDTSSQDDL